MPVLHRRPTRVLHVVQSLGTGGLENGIINLVNGIDPERFRIDILCLRYRGELCERLKPDSKVYFREATATSIARSVWAVRRLCRDRKYDIVHTHGFATLLPGFVGARLAGQARVINGEHGTFFVDTARRRNIQRLLLRLVDANCTVSESLRDEMCNLFSLSRERITPIINGVDVDRFKPDENRRAAARQSLGLVPGDIAFGTVGRLVPVKDYRTLIDGFRGIAASCGAARLVFVGDGSESTALRAHAGELGESRRIIFVGNRDDVPFMMSALDVFCLTSLREGLSNTLLEAHAFGLPAIATKTGGNGEVVCHGETGYLVAVGDSAALADRMLGLARDGGLRRKLGFSARDRAERMFSVAAMVRNYEELYENVLGH